MPGSVKPGFAGAPQGDRAVDLESLLIEALQSLSSFHIRLLVLHFCLDSVLFSPQKATPRNLGYWGDHIHESVLPLSPSSS